MIKKETPRLEGEGLLTRKPRCEAPPTNRGMDIVTWFVRKRKHKGYQPYITGLELKLLQRIRDVGKERRCAVMLLVYRMVKWLSNGDAKIGCAQFAL